MLSICQTTMKALLVVDIQNFYFPGGRLELYEPEKAAENAGHLIELFRSVNQPVIYIQHESKNGMEIYASIKPATGDKVFIKKEINSFNGTGLKNYLDSLGVKELVICGMQTHMCVEAATRAASDFGYKVILVSDACTTRNLDWNGKIIGWEPVHLSTLVTLKNYAEIFTTEEYMQTFSKKAN